MESDALPLRHGVVSVYRVSQYAQQSLAFSLIFKKDPNNFGEKMRGTDAWLSHPVKWLFIILVLDASICSWSSREESDQIEEPIEPVYIC